MPRAVNGTYSLPAGNPVTTLTVISSTWANTTLSDLSTAMTDSLSRSGQGAMTAGLQLFDGALGAPGLTWATEPTSGLYRAGLADFRWSIAGTDILALTGSGVSFIGVSTLANPSLQIKSTRPSLEFWETDATANNQRWQFDVSSDQFTGKLVNDAGVASFSWLTLDRTANVADDMQINITAIGITTTNITFSTTNGTAAGTWQHTGQNRFTSDGSSGHAAWAVKIESALPAFGIIESDAIANQKNWAVYANNAQLNFAAFTDDFASVSTFMEVTRSGGTVSGVNFPAMITSTAAQTAGPATSAIYLNSTAPAIGFRESDAPADNRLWDIICNAETMQFRAVNDAVSIANSWLTIDRTGATIDAITFANGNVAITNLGVIQKLSFGSSGRILLDNGAGSLNFKDSGDSTNYFSINNLTGVVQYGGIEVGYRGLPIGSTNSGNYTLLSSENGKSVAYNGGGGHTFTLPSSMVGGEIFTIQNAGSGNLTVACPSTQSWYNGSGAISTGNRTLAVGGIMTLQARGSNTFFSWGTGVS